MSYHQTLLALHLLAMALGIGITFSNLVNFRLVKTQSGDVAKGLNLQRAAMHRYTDIAFVTILLSGGLLLANLGGASGLGIRFHIKMAAVAVFVVGYVLARFTVMQIQRSGDTNLIKRVKMSAHIAIIGAVLAAIFAVMTFAA
jgi:hypothetical protein